MLYKPVSKTEWWYAGLAFTTAVVSCVLQGFIYVFIDGWMYESLNNEDRISKIAKKMMSALPIFLAMVVSTWLYLLAMCYDTLATKNIYLAWALPSYNVVILAVLALQLCQVLDVSKEVDVPWTTPCEIEKESCLNNDPHFRRGLAVGILSANMACIFLLTMAQIWLARKLKMMFGGVLFRLMDANLGRRRQYQWVEALSCFVKLDLLFFPGFLGSVMLLQHGNDHSPRWYWIPSLIATMFVLLITSICVRREHRKCSLAISVSLTAFCGYMAYYLTLIHSAKKVGFYTPIRWTVTVLGILAVISGFLTGGTLCKCVTAFGQGLKEYLAEFDGIYEQHSELSDLAHRHVQLSGEHSFSLIRSRQVMSRGSDYIMFSI